MAISDLDKKRKKKPGGVGLGVNMRREVGDSEEYEPSLKELCSKGMQKNRGSHCQRKGDQKKEFF